MARLHILRMQEFITFACWDILSREQSVVSGFKGLRVRIQSATSYELQATSDEMVSSLVRAKLSSSCASQCAKRGFKVQGSREKGLGIKD